MQNVKVKFEVSQKGNKTAVSWADREESARDISINILFAYRLLSLKEIKSEDSEKEIQIIVVFIAICICHEVAHLVLRLYCLF